MTNRVLMLMAVLLFLGAAADPPAPPVVGLWQTQDGGGVISIGPCGDKLCAHIAGVVLDNPTDPMPKAYNGVSQCGLRLIGDAAETKPHLWTGHILDPRNGSTYRVELWLQPNGHLALRGYLGVALLGRTESWTRYTGGLPPDCRLSPEKTK